MTGKYIFKLSQVFKLSVRLDNVPWFNTTGTIFSSFFFTFRVDTNSDNLNLFFFQKYKTKRLYLTNVLEDNCEKIVIYVHFDL